MVVLFNDRIQLAGAVSSANYIAKKMINGKEREVSVVQSLAKQFEKLPNENADKTADIFVFVNPDINWNFIPNQYEINKKEIDFEGIKY